MSSPEAVSTVIRGGRILSDGVDLGAGDVLIADGRVAAAGGASSPPPDAAAVDAGGLLVLPGLVDVHLHGMAGYDVCDGIEALAEVAAALPAHGTTAFLATAPSLAAAELRAFVASVAEASITQETDRAELLGCHLEGPWLNPRCAGAHNRSLLRLPERDEVAAVIDAVPGAVRRVTLAPELAGAGPAMAAIAERGAAVSIGHSAATYDEAMAAMEGGALQVTHLFNAMAPLHQRSPGIVGAALAHGATVCELIADGAHVHPMLLAMAVTLLGPGRVALVSDALPVAGLEAGSTVWQGRRVSSDGTVARLNGTLAGGARDLLAGLRVLRAATSLPLADLVPCATSVPARLAGVAARKGSLAVGMDADVVLLDDDLELVATFCRGRLAFARDAEAALRCAS